MESQKKIFISDDISDEDLKKVIETIHQKRKENKECINDYVIVYTEGYEIVIKFFRGDIVDEFCSTHNVEPFEVCMSLIE